MAWDGRDGLGRLAGRVGPQKSTMLTALGTAVRVQTPKGHPPSCPRRGPVLVPPSLGQNKVSPPSRLAVFVSICVSRNAGWLRPIPHSNANNAFRICLNLPVLRSRLLRRMDVHPWLNNSAL